jgi:hypothetical protein
MRIAACSQQPEQPLDISVGSVIVIHDLGNGGNDRGTGRLG